MSLTDWVAHPLDHLKKYSDLGTICLQDVSRFDDCEGVWAIIGIGLGIVAIIVLGFIARHFVREYSAHQRYRNKKLAELEIAPEEIMNEHIWSEDKLDVGLTQEQMIQKIKEAKAKQRIGPEEKTGNRALGDGNR